MAAPQYPLALNSLQKDFKECYEKSRKAIKLPQYILKDLEQYTLFLADLELNDEDCPILATFLTGKLAASKIDKLMIGPKTFSIIPHARRGDLKNESNHSALNLDKAKLWKAVIKFIENSENLKLVIVDSVFMSLELIHMLGLALSATKSKIKWFGLKNVPLEDRGLRFLSPHLAKSSIQLLALEKCGLTDVSTSYLASIIKAQEARMDSLYWNQTLRQSTSTESAELMSSGLIALSISGNNLNGESLISLARVLKRNDWLLALNLGKNELTKESIVSFVDAIKTNSSCHVIVFNGNPGMDMQLNGELVHRFHNICKASTKFSVLSSNISGIIKKWITESESFESIELPVNASVSYNSSKIAAANTSFNNSCGLEGSTEFERDYLNTTSRVDESTNSLALNNRENKKLDALEHGIPTSPQLHSFDVLDSTQSHPDNTNRRPPSRSGVRQRHFNTTTFGLEQVGCDAQTSQSKNNFNLALANFDSIPIQTTKRPQSAPVEKKKISNALNGKIGKIISDASITKKSNVSALDSSTRMKIRNTNAFASEGSKSASGGYRTSPTRQGSASTTASTQNSSNSNIKGAAKSAKGSKAPKKGGGGVKIKSDQLNQVMDKMIEISANLSNVAEKLNESLSISSSAMSNSRQEMSFLQESKFNSSNVFDDMDISANQNPNILPGGSGEKKQLFPNRGAPSIGQIDNQHLFSPSRRGGSSHSPSSTTYARPMSASPYNSRDTTDILTSRFASASLDGNDGKEILQLIRDRLREKLKVHLSS